MGGEPRASGSGKGIRPSPRGLRPDEPRQEPQELLEKELEALLETSDVVSLHVPLTNETRDLIDSAAVARMKPDAILINAARGGA